MHCNNCFWSQHFSNNWTVSLVKVSNLFDNTPQVTIAPKDILLCMTLNPLKLSHFFFIFIFSFHYIKNYYLMYFLVDMDYPGTQI